jgi:hypothetical protein
MTRDDLLRWEQELTPLVPIEGASPLARNDAFAFNDDAKDAMDALREAVRESSRLPHVEPVVERRVAELAFWRRVLVDVHGGELRSDQARPDVLVRYLLS